MRSTRPIPQDVQKASLGILRALFLSFSACTLLGNNIGAFVRTNKNMALLFRILLDALVVAKMVLIGARKKMDRFLASTESNFGGRYSLRIHAGG